MARMKELSLYDTLLKDWDISFQMSGESLLNILEFCKEINLDVLFRFRKDGILMHQKSEDNTQYFEINIPWNDVNFYDIGIEDEDIGNKEYKEGEQENKIKEKLVLITIKKLISDLGNFVDKVKPVDIRIDTKVWKRMEFSANNTSVWTQMIDPSETMKKIDKMPDIIAKQRAVSGVPVGIVSVEPLSIIQICKLGPTGKKATDDDSRMFIELIPDKGLIVSSGGKMSGRVFKIPVDTPDEKMGEEITKQMGIVTDVVQETIDDISGLHNNLSIDDLDDMGGKEKSEEEIYGQVSASYDDGDGDEDENVGQHGLFDEFEDIEKKKEKKKEKKRIETEKKKGDKKGRRDQEKEQLDKQEKNIHLEHQVLQWDVHEKVSVYIQQDYLAPFVKLKGTSPVIIEVRTDRPIIIIQKIFNDTRALLTIAPRAEGGDED